MIVGDAYPVHARRYPTIGARMPIHDVMVDLVMVQCWLFAMELGGGASYARFLHLIDDFPPTYRGRAQA